MKKIENGEQYLNMSMKTGTALDLILKAIAKGDEQIDFPAFLNKNKTTDDHPNYKGTGLAVWINHKKTAPTTGVVEINKV